MTNRRHWSSWGANFSENICVQKVHENPPTNYKIDLWKSALNQFWNCFKIFVFQVHSEIMTGYAVNVKIPETNFNYTN